MEITRRQKPNNKTDQNNLGRERDRETPPAPFRAWVIITHFLKIKHWQRRLQKTHPIFLPRERLLNYLPDLVCVLISMDEQFSLFP